MPRHDYVASPGGTLRNKKTGQCKGVTKSGSKYRAKVWCTEQGKYKNLGSFDDEREAAAAAAAAEAGGTQYLPSPRPYVRRKNALTHGALLLSTDHSQPRPTDTLTDCVLSCALSLLAAPTGNLPLQQRQQWQQRQQQPQQPQQVPLSPSSAITFVNAVFDDAPPQQYTAPQYAFGRSALPVLARSGAGPPSAASAAPTMRRARPLPASLRAARTASLSSERRVWCEGWGS